MRMPLCFMAVAAAFWVSGCTHAKKSTEKNDSLTPDQEKEVDEIRAEVEIGRNMAGRLLGYYGIIDDDKLVGYVNQLGSYVASYSDFPERKYMFAILRHEGVNAFACPGGYILITMGALRNAQNEAELAAVLGHEIAHVGKRHMFNTLKEMKEKDLEAAAKKRQASGKYDEAVRVRERPHGDDSDFAKTFIRYLKGRDAGLNLMMAAQAGMTVITEKGLKPELEFEADHEGVKYAIRAGYEPQAMLNYLTRLGDKDQKQIKNLEKTHPPIEDRKREITKLLQTLKAEDIIGATGEERFDKVKATFPKPET